MPIMPNSTILPLSVLPMEARVEQLPVLIFYVDPAAEKVLGYQISNLSEAAGTLAMVRACTTGKEG